MAARPPLPLFPLLPPLFGLADWGPPSIPPVSEAVLFLGADFFGVGGSFPLTPSAVLSFVFSFLSPDLRTGHSTLVSDELLSDTLFSPPAPSRCLEKEGVILSLRGAPAEDGGKDAEIGAADEDRTSGDDEEVIEDGDGKDSPGEKEEDGAAADDDDAGVEEE